VTYNYCWENEMARPTKFDRETVLNAAIETFRDAGFCATRMPDLVQSTKLQPGSLYAAFDSKQGLLEASLAHYAEHGLAKIKTSIAQASSPLTGVKAVLQGVVEESIQDKKGCLLVNTLLELSQADESLRAQIVNYLAAIEQQLFQALIAAQQNGEIGVEQNPQALSKFLMLNLWGFKVMAKTGADNDSIRSALNVLLATLDAA